MSHLLDRLTDLAREALATAFVPVATLAAWLLDLSEGHGGGRRDHDPH